MDGKKEEQEITTTMGECRRGGDGTTRPAGVDPQRGEGSDWRTSPDPQLTDKPPPSWPRRRGDVQTLEVTNTNNVHDTGEKGSPSPLALPALPPLLRRAWDQITTDTVARPFSPPQTVHHSGPPAKPSSAETSQSPPALCACRV